jgi:hypothetical protein
VYIDRIFKRAGAELIRRVRREKREFIVMPAFEGGADAAPSDSTTPTPPRS